MKQILVLIENELEQSITGDILRSGLGAEAEITLTAGAEQAIQQLQSGAVDLFIADVERFDVAHCNMVTTARKTARTLRSWLHRWGRRRKSQGMSGASASGIICSSRTGPRGCWLRCAPWCVRSAAADAPPTSRRFT